MTASSKTKKPEMKRKKQKPKEPLISVEMQKRLSRWLAMLEELRKATHNTNEALKELTQELIILTDSNQPF